MTRRMRSLAVSTGIVTVLAASLSGCDIGSSASDGEYDYVSLCVNQQTEERVEDDKCTTPGSSQGGGSTVIFSTFYMSTRDDYRAPAVGERLNRSYGTFTAPPSGTRVQHNAVPKTGGIIKRGGFGIRSESVSGGS